jgi:solute carrier family 25 S-adenosylmethionine transporter 26
VSGGFKGIYTGLQVAALGSVPGAALFFSTYETMKGVIPRFHNHYYSSRQPLPDPVVHMSAAGIGEIVACLVRVPTEVIKQRYQAKVISQNHSLIYAIKKIYQQNGILKGFYTGYLSTICREIPFSFIQFPLYEWMKVNHLCSLVVFSFFLFFFPLSACRCFPCFVSFFRCGCSSSS